MKRRLRFAAILIAVAISGITTAFATEERVFFFSSDATSVAVGDTVSLTLSISNNDALAALIADVSYDDDSFSCHEQDVVEESLFKSSEYSQFIANTNLSDRVRVVMLSAEDVTQDGALFTVSFTALKPGTHKLRLNLSDVLSVDSDNLPHSIDGSVITINVSSPASPLPVVPEESKYPEIPPVPSVQTPSFFDVPETHWAYPHIQNAVKNGLFSGIGNGMFGPAMNVTRGMFVTTLYSSAGSPDVELSNFTDVPSDAWYAKAVAWASQQGIVSGIGNNKFGPDLPITREQIALILFNYADGVSPGTEMFVRLAYPDAKDIHDWALTAFTWAMNKELISGKSGNILDPLATATRAEVAVIMQNFVNLSK